jgi:hypothetical protein
VVAGSLSTRGFVQLMIVLFATAWILHGLSLLSGLITKVKVNSAVGGTSIFLVVFFLGGPLIAGGIFSAQFVESMDRLTFYGISLPWLAVVLLDELAVLYFIFLATRRRMASERMQLLSKPQAIASLITLVSLAIGDIWGLKDSVIAVGFLYGSVVVAILLMMMVTPDRAAYIRGLWRARKHGRTLPPAWDDLALNRLFLLVACAIVLVGATLVWNMMGDSLAIGQMPPPKTFPLAIATGVLVVAYFGLALQFFSLWGRVRGLVFFGLFLFIFWLVPLVAGTIVAMASPMGTSHESQVVLALSPAAGLALLGMPNAEIPEPYRMMIQSSALTPALLFTFVFNGLYNMARRRILDEVKKSQGDSVENVPVVLEATSMKVRA